MKLICILCFAYFSFFTQNITSQTITIPGRFPFQDKAVSTCDQPQPLQLQDGRLMMIFTSNDTIYCCTSSDGARSWTNPITVTTVTRKLESEDLIISGTITKTGRIIVVYSVISKISSIYKPLRFTCSDNGGSTWAQSKPVLGGLPIKLPFVYTDNNNTIWISGNEGQLFYSTNNGDSWIYKPVRGNTFHSLVQLKDNTLIGFYQKKVRDISISISDYNIYLKKSTDNGQTWSDSIAVAADILSEERPRALITQDGTIYVFYQLKSPTQYTDILQYDIYCRKSRDNGNIWSEPIQLTKYAGYDGEFNVTLFNQGIFISFLSDRYYMKNQIWNCSADAADDELAPPAVYKFSNSNPVLKVPVTVAAYFGTHKGISRAALLYSVSYGAEQSAVMHADEKNVWTGELPPIELGSFLQYSFQVTDLAGTTIKVPGKTLFAQTQYSWMAAGSMHNFYSSMGSETEFEMLDPRSGLFPYGWSYPGIYNYQDMQIAKGLWVGARDFTDENGSFFPNKIVHLGPRYTGYGEFFPADMKTYSRFEPTKVIVNGKESFNHSNKADIIDPSISADRMIVNTVNTRLGISFRRRIMQFSRQFNDNYIIKEYTFKNTGNTNFDEAIELPNDTLKNVYFYFNYRWWINRQFRFGLIYSNPWFLNTMYDSRGDGVLPDPQGENYRTSFGWHGYYKSFLPYNNIGGPIWDPKYFYGERIASDDTTGRLAAPQFAGILTLHCDKSTADHSDNSGLPLVTYLDNDNDLFGFDNSAYNDAKMKREYVEMLSRQTDSIRHAYKIHPAAMAGGAVNFAEFANQTTDPSIETGGGYGVSNSYGPYTIAPGDSVTITLVEGAASISREAAFEMGKKYKSAYGSPQWSQVEKEKNLLVLTGKDSLMQTWKRVTESYNSGWKLPIPPNPPGEFTVNSLEDRISLCWKAGDPAIKGFEIYRASGKYEGEYNLIKSLPPEERSFKDTTAEKGVEYFYYILSTGDEVPADTRMNTPQYRLKSSRYYTQTYDGAFVGTSGVEEDAQQPKEFRLFANYPNPFNPLTTIRFQIPEAGKVTLKVYDLLGKEVAALVNEYKPAGNHKVQFNGTTLSSGVYVYTIQAGRFRDSKKLMILK